MFYGVGKKGLTHTLQQTDEALKWWDKQTRIRKETHSTGRPSFAKHIWSGLFAREKFQRLDFPENENVCPKDGHSSRLACSVLMLVVALVVYRFFYIRTGTCRGQDNNRLFIQ